MVTRLPALGSRWTWLNHDYGLFAMVAEGYRQPWQLSLESLPNSPVEPIGIIHNQKSARDDSAQEALDFSPHHARVMAAVQVDQTEVIEWYTAAISPDIQMIQLAEKQFGIHHVMNMIGVSRQVPFHGTVVPIIVFKRGALVRA